MKCKPNNWSLNLMLVTYFPLMLGHFPLMLGHFPFIQWHSMKWLKFENNYRFHTNICVKFLGVCCHTSMIILSAIHLSIFLFWFICFCLAFFPSSTLTLKIALKSVQSLQVPTSTIVIKVNTDAILGDRCHILAHWTVWHHVCPGCQYHTVTI